MSTEVREDEKIEPFHALVLRGKPYALEAIQKFVEVMHSDVNAEVEVWLPPFEVDNVYQTRMLPLITSSNVERLERAKKNADRILAEQAAAKSPA